MYIISPKCNRAIYKLENTDKNCNLIFTVVTLRRICVAYSYNEIYFMIGIFRKQREISMIIFCKTFLERMSLFLKQGKSPENIIILYQEFHKLSHYSV